MQAELTGRRLSVMAKGVQSDPRFGACPMIAISSSNMTRAKETAEIIAKQLNDSLKLNPPDPLLDEAL